MIVPQYIEPDYWNLFREDAVVTVEERSETEGVIVDSKSFGKGLPIPQLGDSVRLPDTESTWRKASFAPRLRGVSLTDPSELVIVAHAGRRLMASDGMPGTVIDWTLKAVRALMDDGTERILGPYFVTGKAAREWELLTRSEPCRVCRRPISIYTPFLTCGACADARGEQ
jgi:hypothetical protein